MFLLSCIRYFIWVSLICVFFYASKVMLSCQKQAKIEQKSKSEKIISHSTGYLTLYPGPIYLSFINMLQKSCLKKLIIAKNWWKIREIILAIYQLSSCSCCGLSGCVSGSLLFTVIYTGCPRSSYTFTPVTVTYYITSVTTFWTNSML